MMKWKGADHFCERLRRRGFEYLGGGCYSQVWGKRGSKRVIKVCQGVDPWAEYVLWATQRGYAGKLAPLVYSFRIIETPGGYRPMFYVAVVERLAQTVWQHDGDSNGPMTKLAKDIARGIYNDSPESAPEEHRKFIREFRKQFASEYRCSFDLHMSNFMVQPSPWGDRLVLVDPLSGDGKSSSKRWRHDRVPLQQMPLPPLPIASAAWTGLDLAA